MLLPPDQTASYILSQLAKNEPAHVTCSFFEHDEWAGFEMFFDRIVDETFTLMLSFKSKKVHYRDDEILVDYSWYLNKFLEITKPYGLGYIDVLSGYADPIPLEKWQIQAFIDPLYQNFLLDLNSDPLMREQETKVLIKNEVDLLVQKVKSAGYSINPINSEDIANNERIIEFTIYLEDLVVQVEINDCNFYVSSIEKLRNVRPYVEILYTICQDYCVYRYFAYNGTEKYYSE
jgi:hypothetical protein